MSTNQQRRDAERRRLQRQLEERRAREAARKRFTLIASIVTTLVVIAAVVVVVIVATSGDSGKKKGGVQAGGAASQTAAATSSPAASPTAAAQPPAPTAPCASAGKGATATFHGITVGEATNIAHEPKVSGAGTGSPTNLICQDLVVGTGKAATPTSTVTVQYTGVLFKDGKKFDSSWSRGQATQFPLTGVVPGFTEGIGGAGKVAPMKVGGRRIMIFPGSLGYGAQANGAIPANATLVFVVDLKSING